MTVRRLNFRAPPVTSPQRVSTPNGVEDRARLLDTINSLRAALVNGHITRDAALDALRAGLAGGSGGEDRWRDIRGSGGPADRLGGAPLFPAPHETHGRHGGPRLPSWREWDSREPQRDGVTANPLDLVSGDSQPHQNYTWTVGKAPPPAPRENANIPGTDGPPRDEAGDPAWGSVDPHGFCAYPLDDEPSSLRPDSTFHRDTIEIVKPPPAAPGDILPETYYRLWEKRTAPRNPISPGTPADPDAGPAGGARSLGFWHPALVSTPHRNPNPGKRPGEAGGAGPRVRVDLGSPRPDPVLQQTSREYRFKGERPTVGPGARPSTESVLDELLRALLG